MIKEPEVKLSELKKGDCFMFNRDPYIIMKTYWENLGMMKRKIYVCRMKFDDCDSFMLSNTDVYRISRGLFDLLVRINNIN